MSRVGRPPQRSVLILVCGDCLVETRHPGLQKQDEINFLVRGQIVQSGLCAGACKGGRAIQGLPEPKHNLALMRLLDRLQLPARSMPSLPEVHR